MQDEVLEDFENYVISSLNEVKRLAEEIQEADSWGVVQKSNEIIDEVEGVLSELKEED